jgi:AraC family transcriptional regulator
VPTPYVSYAAQLPLGGVTLSRCIFRPNPGVTLGSTQSIVAVHTDSAFELEWRDPERDPLQRKLVLRGEMNVNRSDLPVFHRWTTTAKALVIALDDRFVAQTCADAFGRDAESFPVLIGKSDSTVQRLAALCNREISEMGAAGRLYAEGIATSLVVHLFHTYGGDPYQRSRVSGGLAPTHLRRVIDMIEARLHGDLGLAELAALTGLSTHHFSHAFKTSTGLPPHRYLIERRIHRAKELLLGGDRSIAQIADSVGFSSPSHLTFNFRKQTGTTPARYRREIQSKRTNNDGHSHPIETQDQLGFSAGRIPKDD